MKNYVINYNFLTITKMYSYRWYCISGWRGKMVCSESPSDVAVQLAALCCTELHTETNLLFHNYGPADCRHNILNSKVSQLCIMIRNSWGTKIQIFCAYCTTDSWKYSPPYTKEKVVVPYHVTLMQPQFGFRLIYTIKKHNIHICMQLRRSPNMQKRAKSSNFFATFVIRSLWVALSGSTCEILFTVLLKMKQYSNQI